MIEENPFMRAYKGGFLNMLRWAQLDALWNTVAHEADAGWYIYAVGATPPTEPATANEVRTFLGEIDELLRTEHDEDYCGIVYVDDPDAPTFIKIYDPHNLGAVCGSSGAPPPLPGWILSRLPPSDLRAMPMPGNRRRWWRRLFGT